MHIVYSRVCNGHLGHQRPLILVPSCMCNFLLVIISKLVLSYTISEMLQVFFSWKNTLPPSAEILGCSSWLPVLRWALRTEVSKLFLRMITFRVTELFYHNYMKRKQHWQVTRVRLVFIHKCLYHLLWLVVDTWCNTERCSSHQRGVRRAVCRHAVSDSVQWPRWDQTQAWIYRVSAAFSHKIFIIIIMQRS